MLYALVDCNNFYASCERAFNPRLENKPVVVLSNNDGCVIARSNEAKKLGIPMGAPFFKWKFFCKQHAVHAFSSNYELYGDMSHRVMTILKDYNPAMEVYSIDEAFVFLQGENFLAEMAELRLKVKMQTGIPISIGIGQTRTLAKMANQLAKSHQGVFFLRPEEKNQFEKFPVRKIWGVGSRLAEKLKRLNIDTAQKLRIADAKMIRLHSSVVLEKTVQELNGISCIETETNQPRKQIISSRSFGRIVTELSDIEEAVSHYMKIASEKLRGQKGLAAAVHVYLQTSLFKEGSPRYGNAITFPLASPSADTRYLISVAKKCVRQIYQKDYQYNKAGVMLLDISSVKTRQYDLLLHTIDQKGERVMDAIDKINEKIGKNTLFFAAEGIERDWKIKAELRSSRYTTQWNELVRCGFK